MIRINSKRKILTLLVLVLSTTPALSQVSAIYGGGPIYQGRDYSIEELKNSGFNTVIVWTIHIESNGDIGFNKNFPLCEGGKYIGDESFPYFRDDLKDLKSPGSSINRIEFGISAWASPSYENIKMLYEKEGVGSGSKLYENFKALIEAIPEIDAFNNDDEVTYDVESSVAFHTMLYELGAKTSGVPYKNTTSYWKPFISQMNAANPGSVDGMYLQVYAGGAENDPCSSEWQDLGVPIIPGVWGEGSSSGNYSPPEVKTQMSKWKKDCGINGGFMWLYDDFDQTEATKGFASAINTVFDISVTPESGTKNR